MMNERLANETKEEQTTGKKPVLEITGERQVESSMVRRMQAFGQRLRDKGVDREQEENRIC